ncbi:MAG: glycine--tRNA ligase subunit beta [Parvularcula sp.]
MPELLLELFSEEIPARLQARASADLERKMADRLKASGFDRFQTKSFATPRRLTLAVTDLPALQPDRHEEKKGPRVGAPEKAVAGFLKSAGLKSLDDAETRTDKKGDYYVAVINEQGRPTSDLIAEAVPDIINDFPWPKSMRWGSGRLRWTRPLHRILCAFNGEVVPFEVDGIKSNDETEGHRFMAPAPFRARSFEAYQESLSRANVILDAEERRAKIDGEAKALAVTHGLELVEDPGLLAEVTGLAEWPTARIGGFDPKFLTVPDEALIASMRGHQKYFSLKDPKTGHLAPKFICVANVEPSDGGVAMMGGYERVLEARLSDAWFLYRQDLKVPLAERAKKLSTMTFFEGLGTVADKVDRVAALAREIAPIVGADPNLAVEAAQLAKADLVTEMVYEFPELQGIMGRYYALEEGLDPSVADAIRDHYKPQGQNDEVPTAPVSVAVALAEKLATLAMFWSIDQKPTGSKDPFALRRAALGVIQIVLGGGYRIGLLSAMAPLDEAARADLLSFFQDRLSVYLRDQGYRHDHIKAVLNPSQDDMVPIAARLKALAAFLGTDEGKNLISAYKRAGNILKAEAKKGNLPADLSIDPAQFAEPAERTLHEAMTEALSAAGTAVDRQEFAPAMAALATLRAPLDAFFEDVTVNTDDSVLRNNRLALLNEIIATCDRVADFSQLEG